MSTHRESARRESRRLQQLRRELLKDGYDVALHPRNDVLPLFLQGLAPDLVASKGAETLVIEVKTKESVRGDLRLEELASALEGRPGWSFQLVLTNPRIRHSDPEARPAPLEAVDGIIRSAETARSSGDFHSGFILLWTAFEATLRHLLPDGSQEGSPLALVKTAYSLGHIDEDELRGLTESVHIRNRVVHGIAVTPSWAAFDFLRAVISRVRRKVDAG